MNKETATRSAYILTFREAFALGGLSFLVVMAARRGLAGGILNLARTGGGAASVASERAIQQASPTCATATGSNPALLGISVDHVRESIRRGASGFIIKPCNTGKELDTVRQAWAAKSPAARRVSA